MSIAEAAQLARTQLLTTEGLKAAVRSNTMRVALLALGVKIVLLVYAWLAYVAVKQEERVVPTDPGTDVNWLRIWSQWDVGMFIRIADGGYVPDDAARSSVFPLMPYLMRALSYFTENSFTSGFIISNVAMIGAAVLLYKLALLLMKDEGTAYRAAFYSLIFPAAFYTSTAYSEGLYLALTLATFYLMERRRWLWSGVAGAMVAATRSVGVFIVVPLAWAYLMEVWRKRRLDWGALMPVLVVGGLLAVMAVLYIKTGDPFHFVKGYAEWGRKDVPNPILAFWRGFEVLTWQHIVPGFEENWTTNALNFGAGVLWVILTVFVFRTLGVTYGLYCVIGLIVPLLTSPMGDRPVSAMLRYVHVLFPGLIILAHWGRSRTVDSLITTTFLLLLGLLTALFVRSWNVPGVS